MPAIPPSHAPFSGGGIPPVLEDEGPEEPHFQILVPPSQGGPSLDTWSREDLQEAIRLNNALLQAQTETQLTLAGRAYKIQHHLARKLQEVQEDVQKSLTGLATRLSSIQEVLFGPFPNEDCPAAPIVLQVEQPFASADPAPGLVAFQPPSEEPSLDDLRQRFLLLEATVETRKESMIKLQAQVMRAEALAYKLHQLKTTVRDLLTKCDGRIRGLEQRVKLIPPNPNAAH